MIGPSDITILRHKHIHVSGLSLPNMENHKCSNNTQQVDNKTETKSSLLLFYSNL